MRMLVQRHPMADAAPFDLGGLKVYLRVLHDDEDQSILNIGHASAAEVEHFAQIALLTQTIRVTIFDPPSGPGLNLPIGPLYGDMAPTVTVDGEAFHAFAHVGGLRPYLHWHRAESLSGVSRLEVEYQAGFGDQVASIPRDLTQALWDQAGLHFDNPSLMAAKVPTSSPHMARLAARYRGVAL